MSFIDTIIQWLSNAANYFAQARQVALGWVYPFNSLATPMYYLQNTFANLWSAFISFKNLLVDWSSKISKILDITTITAYFQTWINYATSAYNWVVSALSNITNIINTWWNTTQATVKVWIDQAKQWALAQINNLAGALAEVQTWWNDFKSKIPSLSEILLWFTNWWANILYHLQSWWVERLLDIKALFNSWVLELAPFWAGWQEIRSTIFEFFNDPLEWLWSRFTSWFLGAE